MRFREEAGEPVANNNLAALSDNESAQPAAKSSGFAGLPVEGGDEDEDFGGLMVRTLPRRSWSSWI